MRHVTNSRWTASENGRVRPLPMILWVWDCVESIFSSFRLGRNSRHPGSLTATNHSQHVNVFSLLGQPQLLDTSGSFLQKANTHVFETSGQETEISFIDCDAEKRLAYLLLSKKIVLTPILHLPGSLRCAELRSGDCPQGRFSGPNDGRSEIGEMGSVRSSFGGISLSSREWARGASQCRG